MAKYRRWSWMRQLPSRNLLKWSPEPRFQMPLGTLISSRSCRSSPDSRANLDKPDILLSGPDGLCAVGDTKYKDVLERAANKPLGTAEEVLEVCIQPADWNQLYVYMRMKGASSGFFVVPFWNADADMSVRVARRFPVSNCLPACDGPVRVAVLGLNLLKPLEESEADGGDKTARMAFGNAKRSEKKPGIEYRSSRQQTKASGVQ